MIRPIITALFFFATLGAGSAQAQQTATFKKFVPFRQIVPDIDFFASNRQIVSPYEKPAAEAIARLKTLFGSELPKGAIFICSTLEQKDSLYEPMILKKGYSWTLTATTPDVRVQEVMSRMKSQMGGAIPAEIVARLKNRSPEMTADAEKQSIATVTEQIAYAVMQTMLDKELRYRSSRLDDMGKIPLPDWMDIGIASYVSGANTDLAYLQQHLDQTFPMEDIIAMSRPFVASSSDQNGSGGGGRGGMGGGMGGGFPQGMPPGMSAGGMPPGMAAGGMPQGGFGGRMMGGGGFPGGGFPGGGGNGNGNRGGQRTLPKDEQDRMLFDGQASTLFAYLIEKVGIDRVKELVKLAVEGKESREFITRKDVLGNDFSKIEENWAAWVKTLKAPQGQFPR